MKTRISILFACLASAATLPAATTITVNMLVPNGNGVAGGNGTGVSALGSTSGTVTASVSGVTPNNVVTLPVTTYTVSGVNLTSEGGTANESFTFTVTYSGTTDGTTPGAPAFSGFGNVGTVDGFVSGTETLTATVALASTSFTNLSLTGFSLARAGGVSAGETGTLTWSGGSFAVSNGVTIANSVTGNSFTLTPGSASTINLEGFNVAFSAVPEPASTSLVALGAIALLRRRRTI